MSFYFQQILKENVKVMNTDNLLRNNSNTTMMPTHSNCLISVRKVVETVTEMRLDLALRLYILLPVLKKVRPCFHGQFFFDKVGLSQKNMLV